jgi:hypothetical protein
VAATEGFCGGGLATAPPQEGQKRTPGCNGFPQRVQNWVMIDSINRYDFINQDVARSLTVRCPDQKVTAIKLGYSAICVARLTGPRRPSARLDCR